MRSFASLYRPSYAKRQQPFNDFRKRYQSATIVAILGHSLFLFLMWFRPVDVFKKEEEIVIEVSSASVIPDGQPEPEIKKEIAPKVKPARPVASSDQPAAEFKRNDMTKKNASIVKEKTIPKDEEVERPVSAPIQEALSQLPPERVIEPAKPEPPKESPKEIEKKVVNLPAPEKPIEKTVEKPVDLPVQAPKSLPVLVDKKNKEKEAPEFAKQAGATSSSNSTTSPSPATSESSASFATDTAKGGAAEAMPNRTSSSASAAEAKSAASNATSAPPSAPSTPSSLGIPGGATSDAQYLSRELNNKMPPYPMMAKRMRQEGTVVLIAEVLENGTAGEIRIVVTSGSELLDKVALEAVKKWTFQPARKEGVPYVQRLRIPITFKL